MSKKNKNKSTVSLPENPLKKLRKDTQLIIAKKDFTKWVLR
jgi:hypothetical protein